jgi:hypothetical protein
MHLDDSLVAYKCIFGNDYDYNQDYHATYDQTSTMTYLKSYVEFTLLNDGKKKKKKSEDISFEENKEYMVDKSLAQLLEQLLQQTGINKAKAIKRSMFNRAKPEVLRAKMLHSGLKWGWNYHPN